MLALVAGAVGAAWAAWVLLRRARRRRAAAYAGVDPDAARFARAIEHTLARHAPRPPGATLRRWATTAGVGPPGEHAVNVLYDWVFADSPPTPDARRRALDALRAGSRA